MATTHTWTGAVNNDAANPGNWTGGAPQPGDILTDTISGSTIDITDDALAGNQLRIVRPPSPDGLGTTRNVTLDLSDNAQANLSLDSALKIVANLSGNDTLEASLSGFGVLVAPSDLTVNLAEHTNLHGSFQVDGPGARLTISGGEDTRYVHNATDRIGGTGVIDTKVVGSGAFILT